MSAAIRIRPIEAADLPRVRALLEQHWAAVHIASGGRLVNAGELPGLLAVEGDRILGLLTYELRDGRCEIVTLNAFEPRRGIGTLLIAEIAGLAKNEGWKRLWLMTTNDNIDAIRFYQRRGLVLVAVHRNACDVSRMLKPQIPRVGNFGIPLRDEIELEYLLA